ncbi:MAG: 50S ribosomal protein L4 [Planctomycetota bacterium]|jgi:large subunit ribosomal protein L4
MIEVKAYDENGNPADPVQVDEAWFGGAVRAGVLREAILMYEANRRSGTANTRRRAEIEGSNRKLWRQKHTGRARVADRSAPHRRGGASAFGPRPRDYGYSLPKKALKAALDSAILAKLGDGEVLIADCKAAETPKTKPVAEYLGKIGVKAGQTCLYVTGDLDGVFYRSARNINGLSVSPLSQINAYSIVKPSTVIFSREAFEKLLEGRR